MSITDTATLIAKVGAAVAVVSGGLTWAWGQHNAFLMEQLAPVTRWALVGRIRNYREIQCVRPLTGDQQISYDEALAQYEALVGRRISDTDCDSL